MQCEVAENVVIAELCGVMWRVIAAHPTSQGGAGVGSVGVSLLLLLLMWIECVN